jgi:transcription elongation factor Elf1
MSTRFSDKWLIDLNGPVDVYSEWIDACETVAKDQADKELMDTSKVNAEDLEFSTYGAGEESRKRGVGGGDDDLLNDEDY